ncbi:hypothetical protein L596_023692 [Steinernema carpocapsae]|uniref:Uncharacterized protein n=1 Tax=Steinernema carpocapsae TaxID=34508 RepID=A0A4U5MEG8_STECR|nr:hypothetical protein L596_023692 [Steinernema carpocapsae]
MPIKFRSSYNLCFLAPIRSVCAVLSVGRLRLSIGVFSERHFVLSSPGSRRLLVCINDQPRRFRETHGRFGKADEGRTTPSRGRRGTTPEGIREEARRRTRDAGAAGAEDSSRGAPEGTVDAGGGVLGQVAGERRQKNISWRQFYEFCN